MNAELTILEPRFSRYIPTIRFAAAGTLEMTRLFNNE